MSIKGFEVGGVQERYDYTALDNIPANLVQDANYVHTDNNYTNADKTKLSGIEAQANKTTIDATLTHSGQAADAKATGDAISTLNAQVIASMPHDTASGSIASFPDGAAMPVIDCSVAVAPNQDLHGYDSPWPAGGGKNKADLTNPQLTTNTTQTVATLNLTGTYTIVCSCDLENANYEAASAAVLNLVANGSNNYMTGAQLYRVSDNASLSGLARPATGRFYAKWTSVTNPELVVLYFMSSSYGKWSGQMKNVQVEISETPTDFAPYSNICPISGWTECKVTRTGKNILPKLAAGTYTANGITATVDSNGLATFSGTAGSSFASLIIPLESQFVYTKKMADNGVYFKLRNSAAKSTVSSNFESSGGVSLMDIALATANRIYNFANQASVGKTVARVRFWISPSFSYNGTYQPSIEWDNVAGPYEPYQGETYTIDLNGTRYGGTLDVTSGKLTVNRAKEVKTWGDFQYKTVLGNTARGTIDLQTTCVYPASVSVPQISNIAPHSANFSNDSVHFYCNGSQALFFLPVNTSDDTAIEISYELATPIVYDLTPTEITTLLGTNNVWADTGDTTVDYYADPTFYINRKIAAAVAAMS